MRKLNEGEGYTVTDICRAFEVSRNSCYYHKNKAERAVEEENDDNKLTSSTSKCWKRSRKSKRTILTTDTEELPPGSTPNSTFGSTENGYIG